MSDIDALVSLTVGVVRSRRRLSGAHTALWCREFVDGANAADNNPPSPAANGPAQASACAPLIGGDDDYND